MKTIRTVTTIIVAVLLFTVNGFSQNADIKALLNKPETKTEVFNTIMNDHQLMTEFTTAMKGNEHAMIMMKNNNQMMQNKGEMGMNKDNDKMHQNEMMGMMKDNPKMMMNMMGNMMDMCEKDSVMGNKMANMMTDHPEMMKMCMEKMNEKGMMGTDGKMKMMKPASSKVEKKHEHK